MGILMLCIPSVIQSKGLMNHSVSFVSVSHCFSSFVCKTVKTKVRKAAYKRYKVTGTGKIMHRKPGKQHLNEKKSKKRLSHLSTDQLVARCDTMNVLKCLGYA